MFQQGKMYVLENGKVAVYNGKARNQHSFRTREPQSVNDMSFAIGLDGEVIQDAIGHKPVGLLKDVVVAWVAGNN